MFMVFKVFKYGDFSAADLCVTYIPDPREEQESPSSLVGALRADLRKAAAGCQKRTRASPNLCPR